MDCLQDVFLLIKNSKLKLNADKTEFLITDSVDNLMAFSRHICDSEYHTSRLSVTSQSNVWWKPQFQTTYISKTCRCCFYLIHDLRRICQYRYLTCCCQKHCNNFSKQQTWLLQFPPLQYCNQGYSKTSTYPTLFSKGSHAFVSFFLLSAASKIIALSPYALSHYLKKNTIAYQALSSTEPVYLKSMLASERNSRQLRSISGNSLYIPRKKTKAGTWAFSAAAPTLWKSLPASV